MTISVIAVTNTWNGNNNTAWNNSLNWTPAHVPLLAEDVVIPTGLARYPIVSTTQTCNSVSIASGASLEIGNGTLTITTGLTSSGQLRLTTELANLYVEDLTFNSGATMYIPYNGANIYISDDLYFNAGSNINPDYGHFRFSGSTPSITINAEASIYSIISSSTNLRHQAGSASLTIKGNLTVNSSYAYICNVDVYTYIYGTISVGTGGILQCNSGTFRLQGNSVNLTTRSGSYFNNLYIAKNTGTTVTLLSNIDINGNLTIGSTSSLVPGSYDINLGGNWQNYAGDNGFVCNYGSSCAVTFDGSGAQIIYSTENFDEIYLNKSSNSLYIDTAAVVWCYAYSRTSGGLVVYGDFEIYTLWDNSIDGTIYVSGSLEINQDDNHGVNITGSVTVESGTFNIYGGTNPCQFMPGASLFVHYGVLAINDVGITINEGFSFTSIYGTIKTGGDLRVLSSTINEISGVFEMIGSGYRQLQCNPAAKLYYLYINKTAGGAVALDSDADINGKLWIRSGTFYNHDRTLYLGGHYECNPGGYFNAGTGTVVIDGIYDQVILSPLNLRQITLNKSAGNLSVINCQVECLYYDWEAGNLYVEGGVFTANDLVDDVLRGGLFLNSNSVVNLHQDPSQSLVSAANIGITAGSTLNLYGGNGTFIIYGTLQMTGGLLDVIDHGIFFYPGMTEQVSGGIIRVNGNVGTYMTEELDLSGSLLEMCGDDSSINMGNAPMLGNLKINAGASYVTTTTDLQMSGSLTVQTGYFGTLGHSLRVGQNVELYDDMELTGNLQIDWGDFIIHAGGSLYAHGIESDNVVITSGNPLSHYYGFTIEPGGKILADRVIFEYMDINGVNMMNGSYIHTTYPFHHCTFRNGAPGGTLLKINNSQDLTLYDVTFPENTWGGAYNVSKTNNMGSLHFVLYMGTFGGQSYEQDPDGRINWSQMAIPPVENLTVNYIGYTGSSECVRLDWDYPIAEATYVIYHSTANPYNNYTVYGTTANKYMEIPVPTTTVKRFFRVTAVLE